MACAVGSFSADDHDFAARAARVFRQAQEQVKQEPTNIAARVQFARAAFERAEFARNGDERADIARQGIEAARSVIQRAHTNAAAHYWLGMNLGQLARTKSLGALKLVRDMETEFLRARALDPHTDFAGPDRSLGYLYRDAPGWPTSIGSKKKAREHLERAVELHPEFPDNQLSLVESLAEWEKQGFERQLPTAEAAVESARAKFTGDEWEQSWADWNKRLRELKAKSSAKRSPPAGKGAR